MPTKTFTQFRVDNVVTTLPTTLNYGEEVYYKDSNGNLTLWVGHEDGTAWPAVGYKEVVVNGIGGASETDFHVAINTLGATVTGIAGSTSISYSSTSLGKISAWSTFSYDPNDIGQTIGCSIGKTATSCQFAFWDGGVVNLPVFPAVISLFVRIYP